MWNNYEQIKPKEGQRIHAIGLWEGEITGQTDNIEEAVGVYSEGFVDITSDHYYAHIYKILYWKDASDIPAVFTFSDGYGFEYKELGYEN